VEGKPLRGYVQGNDLIAVADFERQRAAIAASMVTPAPAETAPGTAAAPPAPKVEKPHYPPFANFSALDMKGKAVTVRGMKGKVNLVCFWSPDRATSVRELTLLSQLHAQFMKDGVEVLGVTTSGDSPRLRDAFEDFHGFRNVPNGYSIAAGFNIDFESLPRTYVLNENYEIITSGLHGKALEDFVKKLVAEK
jgi:hypothetical protein